MKRYIRGLGAVRFKPKEISYKPEYLRKDFRVYKEYSSMKYLDMKGWHPSLGGALAMVVYERCNREGAVKQFLTSFSTNAPRPDLADLRVSRRVTSYDPRKSYSFTEEEQADYLRLKEKAKTPVFADWTFGKRLPTIQK